MKNKLFTFVMFALLTTLNSQFSILYAQGTAFTYQGRFAENGVATNGVVEFQFTLWNTLSGGAQVASATPPSTIINVTNGLFTAPIDFGAAAFDGSDRYLQIEARTTIGPFATLTPRQRITATPYALLAGKLSGPLSSAGLTGTYGNALTFSNVANVFSGNGFGLSNVNAANLVGTVPVAALGNAWKLGGNAGTTPGANFLGTIDNQSLELKANSQRALRLEPMLTVSDSGPGYSVIYSNAPNLIGGSPINTAGARVLGSVIGGGGMSGYYLDTGAGYVFYGPFPNQVLSPFATIAGGYGNTIQLNAAGSAIGGGALNIIQSNAANSTISGGSQNINGGQASAIVGGAENIIQTNANFSLIGGGLGNLIQANASSSIIGGGSGNKIQGGAYDSVIASGFGNTIQTNAGDCTLSGGQGNTIGTNALNSSIGGGAFNAIGANVEGATVPGGRLNTAAGNYSFAAGNNAQALQDGTFVWADSFGGTFSSTAANQFLIRAGGGVGIGTRSPATQLDVRSANNTSQAQILAADQNADTWVQLWSGFNNGANPPAIIWPSGQVLRFISGNINGSPATEWMRIDGFSGNVSIGRNFAANKLEVEGNASKTTAGSWLANSDARIKTQVHTVTHALEKLAQVRPVEFHYTDEYRAQHPSIEDRPYLNVIAQEFQKVFPDAVKSSGDKLPNGDAVLQVDTYPLTIYSAAAIQELSARTEAQLKAKDTEIEQLKQRLAKLERFMNQQNEDAKQARRAGLD